MSIFLLLPIFSILSSIYSSNIGHYYEWGSAHNRYRGDSHNSELLISLIMTLLGLYYDQTNVSLVKIVIISNYLNY